MRQMWKSNILAILGAHLLTIYENGAKYAEVQGSSELQIDLTV